MWYRRFSHVPLLHVVVSIVFHRYFMTVSHGHRRNLTMAAHDVLAVLTVNRVESLPPDLYGHLCTHIGNNFIMFIPDLTFINVTIAV